jgi:hypothetical protein
MFERLCMADFTMVPMALLFGTVLFVTITAESGGASEVQSIASLSGTCTIVETICRVVPVIWATSCIMPIDSKVMLWLFDD